MFPPLLRVRDVEIYPIMTKEEMQMSQFQPTNSRTAGLLWRLILTAAISVIAVAPAQSRVLFKPVGRPPEVFSYEGKNITVPLTNTNSLKSPKLYFIFLGSEFGKDGAPSTYTTQMLNQVQAILNSNYLSGLTQYDSDGHATFLESDYTIDDSFGAVTSFSSTSMWNEIEKILSQGKFSSWLPTADGLYPPIYVVVRYSKNGTGASGGHGGNNSYGPVPGLGFSANAIRVGIPSVDKLDDFTWVVSHELVERMYAGTGGFAEVSPKPGQQICDGEPEYGNNYEWRLGGASGPVVTSYWSVIDQAYIVPDGNLDSILVVPVWNSAKFTHSFLSLQQGTLYLIKTPDTKTVIDTEVQSFVVNLTGGVAQIFELTANGQVRQYGGVPGEWIGFTLPSLATALVSSHTPATAGGPVSLPDGQVYILASGQAYQYNGGSWIPLPYTSVTGIAAADGHIYEVVNPGKGNPFVVEDWTTVITSSTTSVTSIVSVGDVLYMLATNSYQGIWRYDDSTGTWVAVTGSKSSAFSMAAAGDVLVMQASGSDAGGALSGVAQYSLAGTNWIPLTGTNTYVAEILVQDGSELYMLASNNLAPFQMWQYSTPGHWTSLTDLNTTIKSASVDTSNRLHIMASIDGGPMQDWIYGGTPLDWIPAIAIPISR